MRDVLPPLPEDDDKETAEDPPVEENPVAEAEQDLRAGLVLDAKMRLSVLTNLLGGESGTARLLYLIEKLSSHYADMTALLGTGAKLDEWKPGTEEGDPTNIGNVAETFGVQALKQVLPLIQAFLQKKDEPLSVPGVNLPYTAAVCRRPVNSYALSNIVSAMAQAKSAGMDDVVKDLRKKLDEVMVGNAVEATPGVLVVPEGPEKDETEEEKGGVPSER